MQIMIAVQNCFTHSPLSPEMTKASKSDNTRYHEDMEHQKLSYTAEGVEVV